MVGYGTLTVVSPGDLTVKLLDVAYVPEIAFNLFSLMADGCTQAGSSIHN